MAQATLLERLEGIKALIADAPSPSNHDEALTMLTTIINEYEEAHSGVPYAFDLARTTKDGRIYPPAPDQEKPSKIPGTRRYRTRGHNVYIGDNGAIAFEDVKTNEIEFSKPGADGKEVTK